MDEIKTLADYMKEYFVRPQDGKVTLADGEYIFFFDFQET